MQNPKSTIDRLTHQIEMAALTGGRPSLVAETAAEYVDESFVLITRTEFPVKQKEWNGHDVRFGYVTEDTLGGDVSGLRRTGLAYLAMADYLGTKKSLKDAELHTRRFEIWKSFYPTSPLNEDTWGWSMVTDMEEKAINSIIELQDQLEKAVELEKANENK